MTDNERIVLLQNNVISDVNSSDLPLSVKALVLENALLRINITIVNQVKNEKHIDENGGDDCDKPYQRSTDS